MSLKVHIMKEVPILDEKCFLCSSSSQLEKICVKELDTLTMLAPKFGICFIILTKTLKRESKKSLLVFKNVREFISSILLSTSTTTLYEPLQYCKWASYSQRIPIHLAFQPFKSIYFVKHWLYWSNIISNCMPYK